jgi:hypothetical protein
MSSFLAFIAAVSGWFNSHGAKIIMVLLSVQAAAESMGHPFPWWCNLFIIGVAAATDQGQRAQVALRPPADKPLEVRT